jgi:hypothetical protein
MMDGKGRWWVSAIALLMLLAMPATVRAGFAEDAGMGTATVLANIGYVPAKLVYAIVGGITGTFAYGLTGANYAVAERIWNPSLGGDYVINAEQLRGNQPIYFSGTATP